MTVESFESFEELWLHMERQRELADQRVQPWQSAITEGDYFLRLCRDLPIYGLVLPDPEPREPGLEHYRFTRCYSSVCPGGELGDVHVSVIQGVLTRQEFLEAKSRGWYP